LGSKASKGFFRKMKGGVKSNEEVEGGKFWH